MDAAERRQMLADYIREVARGNTELTTKRYLDIKNSNSINNKQRRVLDDAYFYQGDIDTNLSLMSKLFDISDSLEKGRKDNSAVTFHLYGEITDIQFYERPKDGSSIINMNLECKGGYLLKCIISKNLFNKYKDCGHKRMVYVTGSTRGSWGLTEDNTPKFTPRHTIKEIQGVGSEVYPL